MNNDVRSRRLAAGLSQAQLAEKLGVTRVTIISIEKGRFDPSLPLAFRIAEVFGASIEEIFDPERAAGSDPP